MPNEEAVGSGQDWAEAGVKAPACNSRTREAEVGGSLSIQGQPGLLRETLSQETER